MEYYFAHNGLKDPDFGFHLMQNFQSINGEKGKYYNLSPFLKVKMMGTLVLCPLMVVCVKIWFLNQRSANFTGPITLKELETKLADFVSEQVTGQVTEEAGVFHVTIRDHHGMMPQEK